MFKTLNILILFLVFSISLAEPLVTVLDNGLTVITEEMHYSPVIASFISYRVGSRNESGDILGISHFCEHLMFKGTPSIPYGRFWQIVQRDGGMANAFTSEDVTCYYLVLPAGRIDDALMLESDRMVNCLFDPDEVISERNVVHEERRMYFTDSPSGALYEAVMSEAFSIHPYRNPVIGFDENILAYDHIKARNYHEQYYCPSNAVLTLVGDFKTEEMLLKVEEFFGSIPSGNIPLEPDVVEPEQTERRFVEIDHASNLARLIMVFHVPDGLHEDTPILDLIGTYLSGGRSSRLEQSVVSTGLASSAYAYNDEGIDPKLFYLGATIMPGITTEEVEEAIWLELEQLISDDIPDDILDELKVRARASLILQMNTPLYRALNLGICAVMFNDPLKFEKDINAISDVTQEDIRRVAATYFRPDGVTVGILNPTSESFGMISREREDLPTDIQEPTTVNYEGLEITEDMLVAPVTSISDGIVSRTLSNGIQVFVKEDHSFPITSVSFAIPLGDLRASPEMAGLATVTIETMLRGTDDLPYEEFHRRLESVGSYIRFYGGWEYSTGSVTIISEKTGVALKTIADLLIKPAFREDDFNTVLSETRAHIEAQKEDVWGVAINNLFRIMAADPDQAPVVTQETLDRITIDDVRMFHETCSRAEGSVVAVVGDVDPEEIFEECELVFGGMDNPNCVLPEATIAEFSDLPEDMLIETMPGRMQAAVMIGTEGPGLNSPDYIAFSVMNTILGRGIGSRLGHYVRDDQGLAYAVGSWLHALEDIGIFISFLSTRADYTEQAIESVISQIELISEEHVLDIELKLVQSNAVGRHALSTMSYDGQASYLVNIFIDEQPLDYDRISLGETLELSSGHLLDTAARYFGSGEWFISVAGGVDENLNPVFE